MLVLALLLAATAGVSTPSHKPAYTAESVVVSDGETTVQKVWSDGVRTKTERLENGKRSGSLTDESKKMQWLYGLSTGCMQLPLKPPADMHATTNEELAGNETVDGHPTRKFKITSTWTMNGKPKSDVAFVWKAVDLGDITIQRKSADGRTQMNLRKIVLGAPDSSVFAMPPGCGYDEMADTSHNEAEAAGGFRTIRFSDASCKKLVPLPLTMSIPSDYSIRGSVMGCFWGTDRDLARVLSSREEADFTRISRGVFWCRVSDSTEYDPVHKRFVNEQGTDDQWMSAYKAMGATNVTVRRAMLGSFPGLAMSAKVGGSPVYMLYIGVADSPAILINYHPPQQPSPKDSEVWEQFIKSIAADAK